MNIKKINKFLREKAIKAGLCEDWQKNVWNRDLSFEELIRIYLKGIDFSVKKDWIPLDFMKENFDNELLNKNGIFVDEEVVESGSNMIVMLGKSYGVLKYDGIIAVNIYLCHQSELTIEATGGANIFIETYNDSKLRVVATGYAKVFVYQHGGEINTSGNVVIRDRKKAEN